MQQKIYDFLHVSIFNSKNSSNFYMPEEITFPRPRILRIRGPQTLLKIYDFGTSKNGIFACRRKICQNFQFWRDKNV